MQKILFDDVILNKICNKIKLSELTYSKDVYLDMLEVIISQQLSGKVAKVIHNRFLDLFESNYPSPDVLVKFDNKILRNVGLSQAKANYVKNLAQFAIENDLSIKSIELLSDSELIDFLTRVKGVGKWSVEMILMFSLKRPDIFPYDDLVIKKSMVEIYGLKEEGKELINKMILIAEKWRPNRSLASRYLWANYGLEKTVKKISKS